MEGSINCTDILLTGKTGNGKSSTGNSILGRHVFKTRADVSSVTKEIQIEYSEISGRLVKVVDGPGVCDTDLSKEEALEMVIMRMKYAIAANPRGYHTILLVVRYGNRFTLEDQQALQMLKGIFGSDFVQNFVILVVTCADNFIQEEYQSIQEWCSSQKAVFKNLVTECKNRVVFFDNRNAGKMNEQREILFKMIDSLSSSGQRYCNEHFMSAEKERTRIQVETIVPVVREETMMEASLIIQQLGRILLEEPQEQLVQLRHLKERADRLRQGIEEQDKGTRALHDILRNALNICQSIDDQINNATRAIELLAEKRQISEELERIRAEELRYRETQQEEAKNQAEMRIVELQQQMNEADVRFRSMQEQICQKNRAVEKDYHQLAIEQNNNILPLIVNAVVTIVPMLLKMFFKK